MEQPNEQPMALEDFFNPDWIIIDRIDLDRLQVILKNLAYGSTNIGLQKTIDNFCDEVRRKNS